MKLIISIRHPFVSDEPPEIHDFHDLRIFEDEDPTNQPACVILRQGPDIITWPRSELPALIDALTGIAFPPDPFRGLYQKRPPQ